MTDDAGAGDGWFADVDPGDEEGAVAAIRDGGCEHPADWQRLAVEGGFAADEADYYDQLHDATTHAAREAVRSAERADDRQLVRAVRAMDDCERTANELAERVGEWAGGLFGGVEPGVEGARTVAGREPAGPAERRAVSLAGRVVDIADEAAELRAHVEQTAQSVAPNLTHLAGPVLAARLIALAGDLESLAKKPSGTLQVLGAEDALFAHLRGRAPSPKHGVIYVHEYVRGTRPEDRGSAARALAGKLAIAARADHYTRELNPEIERQLEERMATIRAREDDDE